MGYIIHDTKLKHDGGTHNLEVEIEGDQAVVRFGKSFTLRLDEKGIESLADIFQDTLGELRDVRRGEVAADFVQVGIDAREILKESRKSGLLSANRSDQKRVDICDTWNPNDPGNW